MELKPELLPEPKGTNDQPGLQEKLFDEWKDSVVKIKSETGSGTGFFIDDKTIVTNYHVIKNSRSFTAEDSSANKMILGAEVYADPEHDLALLTIKGDKPANIKPIRIAPDDADYTGVKLFHLGHPLGRQLEMIAGTGQGRCDERTFFERTQKQVSPSKKATLQALMDNQGNKPWMSEPLTIIQAPGVTHGSSGAPFLDKDGQVAAIVRKGIRNEDGIIYCAPSKYLNELIANSRRKDQLNLPEEKFFARTGSYETGAEHYFKQLPGNPKGFVTDSVPLIIAGTGAGITQYTQWNDDIIKKTGGRFRPGSTISGLALIPLAMNDIDGYNDAIDPLTKAKYGYALTADATIGSAFAIKTAANAMLGKHPMVRLGRFANALGSVGIAGRLATEFIPNEFSVDIPTFQKYRY